MFIFGFIGHVCFIFEADNVTYVCISNFSNAISSLVGPLTFKELKAYYLKEAMERLVLKVYAWFKFKTQHLL
jgi:hypothetical protein